LPNLQAKDMVAKDLSDTVSLIFKHLGSTKELRFDPLFGYYRGDCGEYFDNVIKKLLDFQHKVAQVELDLNKRLMEEEQKIQALQAYNDAQIKKILEIQDQMELSSRLTAHNLISERSIDERDDKSQQVDDNIEDSL
jgi:hypothetical protein